MTKGKSKPAAKPVETKKQKFVDVLRRQGGITIADASTMFGWLPHTTRAMLTGLRKQGLTIDKAKVDGVTVYAIVDEPKA